MSTLSNLLVKLGLDKADYDKGLSEAQKTATTFGASAVKGLSAIGGAAVLGGFAAAGAAAVGMGVFLKGSVEEAMAAEEAQAMLAETLENTGESTGVTVDMVNELADTYGKLTKFEDDTVVAAGAVLARFDTITADTFPNALGLTLDLATALGTDASSAALMLGKALVSPGEGLLRLKAAGVDFTDEQTKMIQEMADAGDMAGAQNLIMQSLGDSITGLAEAAGDTAAGKMEILKNTFGNVKETIGTALLPVLSELATKMQEWLSSPAVQTGIQNIATAVADFGAKVVAWIPQVIAWFQSIVTFLQENQGLVIGILVALGVAISVFVYTVVIPAAISMIAALAPIVLPILAIIGVVWLLVEAWNNNWFGIRDTVILVWETYLRPVFETLKAWLEVNIPIAIQVLSNFWNNTLKPALMAVWNFIQTNILPIFETVRQWLAEKLVEGIQRSADYWNNTLKPALDAVWAFIQQKVLPVLELLWNSFKLGVDIYVKNLVEIWENKLKPALEKVWGFIQDKVLPIFEDVWAYINDPLIPVLKWLAEDILEKVIGAFNRVRSAIQWVIDKVVEFINKLKGIVIPDQLLGNSPSPFEMSLRGISDAMRKLARTDLPDLEASLRLNPVMGGAQSGYGPGGGLSIGGDRFTINNYGAGSAAVMRGWVESRQRMRVNRSMGSL